MTLQNVGHLKINYDEAVNLPAPMKVWINAT